MSGPKVSRSPWGWIIQGDEDDALAFIAEAIEQAL
jgi:hypothetical protein